MNINDIKQLFTNNIDAFIKEDFIEDLKYFYGYREKIIEYIEREEEKERDGEKFTVKIAEPVEKNNPEDLKTFLAGRILEDLVLLIQEKIREGGKIRKDNELNEATKKIFNKE